ALLSIGCEDAAPSLSGSVTYNGSPVADGNIAFTPIEAGTSFGAKITGGSYQADKVYEGQYRVLVSASSDAQVPKTREEAQKMRQSGQNQPAATLIPADAEGNGQTVEITGGEQTLDFALTGPPQP
ncbi:MAG TPA: hypothetical protein VF175_19330, partial [Lacipirellula sp.]